MKKSDRNKNHSKTDCRKIFRRLSDYLDREISASDCREIERHLSGCRHCGAFMRTLRKTVALCRKSSTPRLSRADRLRILRRIRKAA